MPTGCATRWHFIGKCRNFIYMQHMLFSQVAQHIVTQQRVSLSITFPVSTRLRYFRLCSHQVRTLNEPAKRLEHHVSLVAHPVGHADYPYKNPGVTSNDTPAEYMICSPSLTICIADCAVWNASLWASRLSWVSSQEQRSWEKDKRGSLQRCWQTTRRIAGTSDTPSRRLQRGDDDYGAPLLYLCTLTSAALRISSTVEA